VIVGLCSKTLFLDNCVVKLFSERGVSSPGFLQGAWLEAALLTY